MQKMKALVEAMTELGNKCVAVLDTAEALEARDSFHEFLGVYRDAVLEELQTIRESLDWKELVTEAEAIVAEATEALEEATAEMSEEEALKVKQKAVEEAAVQSVRNIVSMFH